ncbi:MAG: radical SAM protein [Alphaproteobacteria bacterium]|nr:radical SAM protein [Alphaproteobacteria bacterium]
MTLPRVAIIGHFVPMATVIDLPLDPRHAKTLLSLHNYTRVAYEGRLYDHLAYLSKIALRDPNERFSVWEIFLCGPLLLASHLERLGIPTLLVNSIDSDNEVESFERIRSFQPDIIALTTTFVLTQSQMAAVGRRFRQEFPDIFIVAGGQHIYTTLLYMTVAERKDYLKLVMLDAFVNDTQGEGALAALCRSFPQGLKTIPNLIWRDSGGDIHQNSQCLESNDINATPISFDLVPQKAFVHMRTARSCSFKCAFCSYPSIAGELSLMDLELVRSTLRAATEKGLSAVFFTDDTFNVPPDRFERLLDLMIEDGFAIPWYSFLRCQYLDARVVMKMRKAGCAGVYLGVESGSDLVLRNMKKGAVSSFYREGIRWLNEQGITCVGSFMIGFPGETNQTVAETQDFILESGLDYYYVQPFYYLHHTPIHARAGEFGLSGNGLFWRHETMNWQEAVDHVHRLFLAIDSPIHVNPDYTLWEIAYLRGKGMTDESIQLYRREINRLTAVQMRTYGIVSDKP